MIRGVGIDYSRKKIRNKRNSRGDDSFGVNQSRDGKSGGVVSWRGFWSLKQYDVNRIVIARVLRRFENDPVVRKTIKDLCMIGSVYLHGSLVKIDAVEDDQINNKIDQLNDIDVLAIPMLSRREEDGGVNQKLFDRPLKGYGKIDICVWRGRPEEYDYRGVGRTVKDSVLIEIEYKNERLCMGRVCSAQDEKDILASGGVDKFNINVLGKDDLERGRRWTIRLSQLLAKKSWQELIDLKFDKDVLPQWFCDIRGCVIDMLKSGQGYIDNRFREDLCGEIQKQLDCFCYFIESEKDRNEAIRRLFEWKEIVLKEIENKKINQELSGVKQIIESCFELESLQVALLEGSGCRDLEELKSRGSNQIRSIKIYLAEKVNNINSLRDDEVLLLIGLDLMRKCSECNGYEKTEFGFVSMKMAVFGMLFDEDFNIDYQQDAVKIMNWLKKDELDRFNDQIVNIKNGRRYNQKHVKEFFKNYQYATALKDSIGQFMSGSGDGEGVELLFDANAGCYVEEGCLMKIFYAQHRCDLVYDVGMVGNGDGGGYGDLAKYYIGGYLDKNSSDSGSLTLDVSSSGTMSSVSTLDIGSSGLSGVLGGGDVVEELVGMSEIIANNFRWVLKCEVRRLNSDISKDVRKNFSLVIERIERYLKNVKCSVERLMRLYDVYKKYQHLVGVIFDNQFQLRFKVLFEVENQAKRARFVKKIEQAVAVRLRSDAKKFKDEKVLRGIVDGLEGLEKEWRCQEDKKYRGVIERQRRVLQQEESCEVDKKDGRGLGAGKKFCGFEEGSVGKQELVVGKEEESLAIKRAFMYDRYNKILALCDSKIGRRLNLINYISRNLKVGMDRRGAGYSKYKLARVMSDLDEIDRSIKEDISRHKKNQYKIFLKESFRKNRKLILYQGVVMMTMMGVFVKTINDNKCLVDQFLDVDSVDGERDYDFREGVANIDLRGERGEGLWKMACVVGVWVGLFYRSLEQWSWLGGNIVRRAVMCQLTEDVYECLLERRWVVGKLSYGELLDDLEKMVRRIGEKKIDHEEKRKQLKECMASYLEVRKKEKKIIDKKQCLKIANDLVCRVDM